MRAGIISILAAALFLSALPASAQEQTEAEFDQTADVGSLIRLAGPDRLSTAVAIADQLHNPEEQRAFGEILVVASSENFPDALSAGSLAAKLGSPLLLNPRDRLSDTTREAANRYTANAAQGTRTVVLVGGEAALSAQVANDFDADGWSIKRVQGPNRFATAVAAADFTPSATRAFIADGGEFQDAVIASNLAGTDGVLLLTAGGSLPPETAQYLARSDQSRTTIGGAAGIAAPAIPNVSGADYAGTSVAVAQQFFGEYSGFALARVDNFADALAGTQFSGRMRYPLFLVGQTSTPDDVVNEIDRQYRDIGYIYGGENAVSEAVHGQIGGVRSRGTCSFTFKCQLTYSRVGTRLICDQICAEAQAGVAISATAATLACAAASAGLAAAVCGLAVQVSGTTMIADLTEASENQHCFSINYYPVFAIGDIRPISNPTEIEDGELCDRASS